MIDAEAELPIVIRLAKMIVAVDDCCYSIRRILDNHDMHRLQLVLEALEQAMREAQP